MITKKGSLFLSTKPLNSVFIRITRQRHGWQFLQRVFYASFLRRITSITPRDSTQNPASLLARSLWRCGVPDWIATPVLSLCCISARAFIYERERPPRHCAMARGSRELPHELGGVESEWGTPSAAS